MKIYARNCEVVDLTECKDTVINFLTKNHTQGSAAFSLAYGLVYKNELVQLLTFGKPRFDPTISWELIRDCTRKDTEIIGGVSKLWNHFLENNSVRSCLVYTYPHDKEKIFSKKYIDYCGFNNISKAKPEKKIYFEGEWGGKPKRIDKSLLEKLGVDRLLKGNFGQDRTNEQILFDLGFEKREEDGYSPQKDIFFPFSVLFRIDDLTDGSFYIGITTDKQKWDNDYMGTGSDKWQNHLKKYPSVDKEPKNANSHLYKRTIIKDSFETPRKLYEAEIEEIRKYAKKNEVTGAWKITDPKCKNVSCHIQGSYSSCDKREPVPCIECGSVYGHKKTCSQYSYNSEKCPECGMDRKRHKKTCSHYVAPEACSECGKTYGHKKSCSQYKAPDPCPECGGLYGHKKTCSQYIDYSNPCPECGSRTKHKPGCSHYKLEICPECGGKNNHHKNTCSKYNVAQIVCSECGGKEGKHRKGCSKYIGAKECPECGSSRGHKKTCSKYVAPPPCPECGAIKGHLSSCSKAKKCPECGCAHGHNSSCSHYKPKLPCPECGSRGAHKPSCSRSSKNK